MRRIVRSFNGAGRLLLRGGGSPTGRYHVDIAYRPMRRMHEAEGSFVLDAQPAWDSVVEAEYAGKASLLLADGRTMHVTLGGILGKRVAITNIEAPAEA
jgi:hypothetical protein